MEVERQFREVGLLRVRRRVWGWGKERIVEGVGGGGVVREDG